MINSPYPEEVNRTGGKEYNNAPKKAAIMNKLVIGVSR